MGHIGFMSGYHVEPILASESALGAAVHRYYGIAEGQADCLTLDQFISQGTMSVRDSPAGLGIGPRHSPPEQLVSLILWDAICCGASQILIEPRGNVGCVSYRLKGRLKEAGRFPGSLYDRFTNRLRLMCGLSLSDRRKVQEGNFSVNATGQRGPVYVPPTRWTFSFAVSIIPAGDSHKVVLSCAASDGALLPPPGFSDHPLFKTTGSFRLRKVSVKTGRPTRG
jgi:type IV pilus assembly protein PilB